MASAFVSVIIPAYNQQEFLASAIRSVLAQTHPAGEIIVVDDGSGDGTPAVAGSFGDAIRYIRQENRGPASARNTGIRAAGGEFVGLLDSDDEWRRKFLETMLAFAAREPAALAYYCRARCMDAAGRDLPQMAGYRAVAPESLYHRLLRGNFLIPSTMLLRRAAALDAGMFDEDHRELSGCEDYDLWLRMLRRGTFAGTGACLTRYRLHDSSLSAGSPGMQKAHLLMLEKHFGLDDGDYAHWPAGKRRAYGGAYRAGALNALMREHDWQVCGPRLGKALAVDPDIAMDLDLFYELALGTQALGRRGIASGLDLPGNAARLEAALREAFSAPAASMSSDTRTRALATAYTALGLAAYNTGQFSLSRSYLWRAAQTRPALLAGRRFALVLLKAVAGPAVARVFRQRRQAAGSI